MSVLHMTTQLFLVVLILVSLIRRACPTWLGWTATTIGMGVFVAGVAMTAPFRNADLEIFLTAGRDVNSGMDPYINRSMLSTPQVMAVFAVSAWFPPRMVHIGMMGFFLLGPVALTWLGAAAVRRTDHQASLPNHLLGLLSATLALSFSYRYGMELGQLGVVVALGLFGAIIAQRLDRPGLAGVGLFLASLKIATMLPFLLLFFRQRDWKAWMALSGLGLGATLATNPPEILFERCQNCLANIAAQSRTGGLNDVTGANSSAVEILSLDRLFYCLGMHGPLASVIGMGFLLGVGAGIALALHRGLLSRPACVALASIYAILFLYHRVYDSVLLVGALVWAVQLTTTASGRSRWAAFFTCAAILSVWFVRLGTLRAIASAMREADVWQASLTSGVVLAYPIWALVVAGVLVVIADRSYRADCEVRS